MHLTNIHLRLVHLWLSFKATTAEMMRWTCSFFIVNCWFRYASSLCWKTIWSSTGILCKIFFEVTLQHLLLLCRSVLLRLFQVPYWERTARLITDCIAFPLLNLTNVILCPLPILISSPSARMYVNVASLSSSTCVALSGSWSSLCWRRCRSFFQPRSAWHSSSNRTTSGRNRRRILAVQSSPLRSVDQTLFSPFFKYKYQIRTTILFLHFEREHGKFMFH